MSHKHANSMRSSHISSSPSRGNKTSLKLSLIKLSDSFVKPEKTRVSNSLNSGLPQLSQNKVSKGNMSFMKKNILAGDQSPSFISYFSPHDHLNFSNKYNKYPVEKDIKADLTYKNHEEVYRKRESLRNKRELVYKFEPDIKPKLYQSILHLSLLLKTFNEEFIPKQLYLTEEIHLQALDKICEIETSFYKIYEDFVKEIKILQENILESQKNERILEQKNGKLQSKLEETSKELKKTAKKADPKEKEIGFLMFENTKLEMEIQKLNEKLKIFETHDVGPIMKELESVKLESEEKIKDLQIELAVFKGKDENHQNIINFYKGNITKLEKDVKHWIQISGENQKIIDKLEEKNENLINSRNRFRELSYMQLEEIQSLCAKKQENSIIMHDMHEKIKILNLKIDKLTVQKGDNVNEQDFKKDLSLLAAVSELFSEYMFKRITKESLISQHLLANISLKAPNISNTRSYESSSTHPTFLKKFNFLKAPFFKLIEHRFKMANYSLKVNKKPDFHELLTKIRGIFDCKFNEFLLFSDPKLFSSFPDFVYSWLGKYEIDYSTRKVRKMDLFAYSSNNDDIRIQFMIDLTNPKVEKLWECATFCEFLEEKLSLDELYFYLYCRNLLFKGAELEYSSAFFDFIHYVSFETAENLIDLIMHKYDISIKSTIKSKLSEKCKRKGPQILIDGAFVLRVLLEYYRLERIDKFYLLEELFNAKMHKEDEKETVSFENFKKIIQFNWPQITDLETSELYRETWGIGQGAVNAEAFFTLANESRFFIKTLKLPSLMAFDEISTETNPYEKVRKEFFEIYALIKTKIPSLEEIICYPGLEIMEEKFRKMIKTIQSDFQIPSEELKEKFISHFIVEFSYLLKLFFKINKNHQILQNPLKEIEFLKSKEDFQNASKIIIDIVQKDNLRLITENSYARKIQKAFKTKKNQKLGSNITQIAKNIKKQTNNIK